MMNAPAVNDSDGTGHGSGETAAAAAAAAAGNLIEVALPIHAANGLALVLLECGKGIAGGAGEAADLLRGALALAERLLGKRSLSAIQSSANLALALRKLGRPFQSEQQCRATLPLAIGALGEASSLVDFVKECLVQAILDGGGNLADATVIAQKLVRCDAIPPQHLSRELISPFSSCLFFCASCRAGHNAAWFEALLSHPLASPPRRYLIKRMQTLCSIA